MAMRKIAVAFAIAALGLLLTTGSLAATDQRSPARADLEGRPIAATSASDYFCHDFDFPQVHCFRTAERLEAALAGAQATSQRVDAATGVTVSFGPQDYVTAYSDSSYGGSYIHLSLNYDTLYWIGWSDRISSFKVRNNRSGTFWENWYGGGRRTDFCCNHTVPWLAAGVDNTFTSVYVR